MRKLVLFLFGLALWAQNPNPAVFPGRVATDADLFVATNLGSSTLAAPIVAGATSMVLASGVGFTAPVVLVVDTEIFHCTTLSVNILTGCTPGAESTVQAAHNAGATVKNIMTAWHHNQVASDLKAVEAKVATIDTALGIVGLFGSCSGVQYLGADQGCHAPTNGNNSHTVVTSTTPVFDRLAATQEWLFTISTSNSTATTTGLMSGDILIFNLTQCATAGGCTFTWPTGFSEACVVAAGNPLTGVANLGLKQTFFWDGAVAHALTPCISNTTTSDLLLSDTPNALTAAGTFDASASTVANAVKVQVKAGATATVNGAVAYDSTADMLHAAQASADAFIPQSTATPANNDCAKWVAAGSKYKLGTAGAACGGGGITHTHTLAAGAFGGSTFMTGVFNQSNTVGAACPAVDLHFIPVLIPTCYLLWFEDGTTNATHGIVVMDEIPSFAPSAVKLTLIWMDHGSAATYQYKVAYAVTASGGAFGPPTYSTAQNFPSQLSVAGDIYIQTVTLTGVSFVADNLLTMAIGRVDNAGYGHLIQANVEYLP